MSKVTILAVIAILIASSNAILNGEVFPHKPFYARITFNSNVGLEERAGVIIADRLILTTGAFFDNAQNVQVWVGSNIRANQQNHQTVGRVRLSTHVDGPAIIQLTTPLQFSTFVQSIALVSENDRIGLTNEQGMVVGLGGTTPATRQVLHAAFMRVTTTTICNQNYPNWDSNAYFCAFDSNVRSDFCPEDRGSAFTVLSKGREFLVGIAIEGVCSTTQHTRPSVFARMSHFRNRINEILDGLNNF